MNLKSAWDWIKAIVFWLCQIFTNHKKPYDE